MKRAIAKGYTVEYYAEGGCESLHVMVKPDTNLDGSFKAYCLDTDEIIRINGWMFIFDPV